MRKLALLYLSSRRPLGPSPHPAEPEPLPAGVIMVFSMSAFGTYFKLTQSGPSNSSHVGLLVPISAEPGDVHVGLAWLAVGSMCLFIAGKKGLGTLRAWFSLFGSTHLQISSLPSVPRNMTSVHVALTVCWALS